MTSYLYNDLHVSVNNWTSLLYRTLSLHGILWIEILILIIKIVLHDQTNIINKILQNISYKLAMLICIIMVINLISKELYKLWAIWLIKWNYESLKASYTINITVNIIDKL